MQPWSLLTRVSRMHSDNTATRLHTACCIHTPQKNAAQAVATCDTSQRTLIILAHKAPAESSVTFESTASNCESVTAQFFICTPLHTTRGNEARQYQSWQVSPSWVITRVITGLLPYGEKYFLPLANDRNWGVPLTSFIALQSSSILPCA